MKKGNKEKIATIIVILLLVALFVYLVIIAIGKISPPNPPSNNSTDDFAKCLSSKGAKMYGAYWCGHCIDQKKDFGDSWQYIDYVECDPKGENPQTDLCLEKGIQGYPSWEINGKLYPGKQEFTKLAELSGCKL